MQKKRQWTQQSSHVSKSDRLQLPKIRLTSLNPSGFNILTINLTPLKDDFLEIHLNISKIQLPHFNKKDALFSLILEISQFQQIPTPPVFLLLIKKFVVSKGVVLRNITQQKLLRPPQNPYLQVESPRMSISDFIGKQIIFRISKQKRPCLQFNLNCFDGIRNFRFGYWNSFPEKNSLVKIISPHGRQVGSITLRTQLLQKQLVRSQTQVFQRKQQKRGQQFLRFLRHKKQQTLQKLSKRESSEVQQQYEQDFESF